MREKDGSNKECKGRARERDYKEAQENFWDNIYYLDCGVGFTSLCVKTYQIVHLKYMQLILCQ